VSAVAVVDRDATAEVPGPDDIPSRHVPQLRGRRTLVVLLVLAAALGLRVWHLDGRPGTEYDEPVYAAVAQNLADHSRLQVREPVGVDEPYLYHPPFYFFTLAGLDRLFGPSLLNARVLAALLSMVTLALLWLFARRWPGGWGAVGVLACIAADGWLLYTNRVGWIENAGFPILVLGLLLYQRALETSTDDARALTTFSAAGYVLGAAAIFKLTLVVGVLALLVHWIIVRDRHQGHRRAVRAVVRVVFFYAAGMTIIYGQAFLHQVAVQFDRASGRYASRGVVHLSDLVSATTHNYAPFFATVGLLVVGFVMVLVRLVGAMRSGGLDALRGPDSLYLAWSLASVLFLGALSLRYPQYLVLVLVPLYLYVGSRVVVRWRRSDTDRWRVLALVGVCVLLIGDAVAFRSEVASTQTDAIAAATTYLGTLPRSRTVLADEPIGVGISQPYYDVDRWVFDRGRREPDYVAMITTRTQHLPTATVFRELMTRATIIRRFHGFKGDVTVYRICPSSACGSDASPTPNARDAVRKSSPAVQPQVGRSAVRSS
jgi:4-amino-4-deoxy-L-arabinose transferase-like glycosyltransferase